MLRILAHPLRGAWIGVLLLLLVVPLDGQDPPVLELGAVEVFPGANDLPLPIVLSNASAVTALDIGVLYNALVMEATDLRIDGGALAGLSLESVDIEIDPTSGRVMAAIVLDSAPPFDPVLPPGSDQPLGELLFDVEGGLSPGQVFPVVFTDGSGVPPFATQVYVDGNPVETALIDGEIRITNENFLIVEDTVADPGTPDHGVVIQIANSDDLQGFSISLDFESEFIRLVDVNVENTITDLVGAEFVDPIIANDEGFVILGVLLDALPPFERQVIPSSGFALPAARLVLNVLPEANVVDTTPLTLLDGLGQPPISNIFVVENQSVQPQLVSGIIDINQVPMFLRADTDADGKIDLKDPIVTLRFLQGIVPDLPCVNAADANDDEKINISDAVYTLNYLFLEGPLIFPPFPERGVDPTPGELPCNTF